MKENIKFTRSMVLLFLAFSLLPITAGGKDDTDTNQESSASATEPFSPEMGPPPEGNPPGNPPEGGAFPMEVAELEAQESSEYFSDLDSSTADINAYVDYLFEKGLLADNLGDGLFRSEDILARGELASMLYSKYAYGTEGFSYGDVPTNVYYYQAVMRGKASGIFEDTTYFKPDEGVTREQAALWIYRSELASGMPQEMASSDLSSYSDGDTLSAETAEAVATLTKLGLIEPDGEGNFNPGEVMTRSDIVSILYRLSFLGGAPGNGPGMSGAPGMPGGGNNAVDHGTAASTADSDITGKTYNSTGDQENALRAEGDVTVTLQNVTLNKSDGDAAAGDASNFYGSNAAFLALDGAEVIINNATVISSVDGGNGIFSYGEGTDVTVRNSVIRTTGNSSGGVMVTGGGAMEVIDCDIETQGRSSAALRTDRGGGTLTVSGGDYSAAGEGSPSVYCTADITVSDAVLNAATSEAFVVEGKNSLTVINCDASGNMQKDNVENYQNVMIYQSMSGDADTGKSHFSMEGGSLISHNGDMIYVTNTACEVRLEKVELTLSNGILLRVAGNDARNGWGVVGENGGDCSFTAIDQELSGQIVVDEISALDMTLSEGTSFTGSVNSENEGGDVSVTLDESSSWTLTGTSYIRTLSGVTDNIETNGYTLYVGGVPFN